MLTDIATSSEKYHIFVPMVDQFEVFIVFFFYLKRKQPFFPDLLKYIFFFVKSLKASEFEAQQIENLPWNPTIPHGL